MRLLRLSAILAGLFSVGLCHRMNAMDTNQAKRGPFLAVLRVGESFVARLYSRPETETAVVRGRTFTHPNTVYWLDVRRLDTGRTYTAWERRYGTDFADFPQGLPRDFWLAAGEGEKVAVTYFDGPTPICFEVDASRDIKSDGDCAERVGRKPEASKERSAPYIPLGRAVNQAYAGRGLFLYPPNRHSIHNVAWQDEAWHVTFSVADQEWLFVRAKESTDWLFKANEKQEAIP